MSHDMEEACRIDESLIEPVFTADSPEDFISKDTSIDSQTIPTDMTFIDSTNFLEIEKYLSKILNKIQNQQEHKASDVVQLILQQHQDNQLQQPQISQQSLLLSNTIGSTSYVWTFTQGLILGQLSVIVLIVAFIKFFVFTEAAPTQASSIPSKTNISIIKTNKTDDIDISMLQSAPLGRLNEMETINISEHQNDVSKALRSNKDGADSDGALASILEKTYYDVKTHNPESLDWFNVLVAQIISQGRLEALNDGNIYESLNKALNSPEVLQYFDAIKITEINIGDDYPIFSNCRVKNNEGRLEAKIDVDVSDTITLGVETNLLINQPKFMSASLPIKLSISVVRFSACLTVSLIATDDDVSDSSVDSANSNNKGTSKRKDGTGVIPNNVEVAMNKAKNSSNSELFKGDPNEKELNTPTTSDKITTNGSGNGKSTENTTSSTNESSGQSGDKGGHAIALMFSFSPDFRLEFDIKSLIGSRAKLENIPRISSILENVIRKWFIDRCIEPRFQLIKLPSMWPRKKNMRQNVHTEF